MLWICWCEILGCRQLTGPTNDFLKSRNTCNATPHQYFSVAEQVLQIYPLATQTRQRVSINAQNNRGYMHRLRCRGLRRAQQKYEAVWTAVAKTLSWSRLLLRFLQTLSAPESTVTKIQKACWKWMWSAAFSPKCLICCKRSIRSLTFESCNKQELLNGKVFLLHPCVQRAKMPEYASEAGGPWYNDIV